MATEAFGLAETAPARPTPDTPTKRGEEEPAATQSRREPNGTNKNQDRQHPHTEPQHPEPANDSIHQRMGRSWHHRNASSNRRAGLPAWTRVPVLPEEVDPKPKR